MGRGRTEGIAAAQGGGLIGGLWSLEFGRSWRCRECGPREPSWWSAMQSSTWRGREPIRTSWQQRFLNVPTCPLRARFHGGGHGHACHSHGAGAEAGALQPTLQPAPAAAPEFSGGREGCRLEGERGCP
jgi:hypothetical protein